MIIYHRSYQRFYQYKCHYTYITIIIILNIRNTTITITIVIITIVTIISITNDYDHKHHHHHPSLSLPGSCVSFPILWRTPLVWMAQSPLGRWHWVATPAPSPSPTMYHHHHHHHYHHYHHHSGAIKQTNVGSDEGCSGFMPIIVTTNINTTIQQHAPLSHRLWPSSGEDPSYRRHYLQLLMMECKDNISSYDFTLHYLLVLPATPAVIHQLSDIRRLHQCEGHWHGLTIRDWCYALAHALYYSWSMHYYYYNLYVASVSWAVIVYCSSDGWGAMRSSSRPSWWR